jgi:seryl-tRNA synthetase
MLDIKWIRVNQNEFIDGLRKRGISETIAQEILTLDKDWRFFQEKLDSVRSKKNEISKTIPTLNDASERDKMIHESNELSQSLKDLEDACNKFKNDLEDKLSYIPNIPHDDVPEGDTEEQNIIVKYYGEKKQFDFIPRRHDEIGHRIGLSSEDGANISGSRFVVLHDKLARLERGLAAFMLDQHTSNGYKEVSVPFLVKEDSMYGSGNLPKFREDAFRTTDNMWLIPTSEVSLVNLAREKIFKPEELPLHFTAYSPCFRSEAGSSGKASHGLTRVHQFMKVELVKIVEASTSQDEHEAMVRNAEGILEKLGLHYRRVLLCAQEMGFCSMKTYDLEVWLPAEGVYREISSCSNCGDFQARRIKSRMKSEQGNELVHTLNGSGLAVGRTIIALLENYQNEDGSVQIPDILVPYVGFDKIEPDNQIGVEK